MWDAKFMQVEGKAEDYLEKESLQMKRLKDAFSKNRELSVLLERERTKNMQLESKVDNLEQKAIEIATSRPISSKSRTVNWKSKYSKLEEKLQEERLKATILKNELNKAKRILSEEIGDFKTLDDLLNDKNGRTRRAQQTEIMRGQIKDLRSKVRSSNGSFTLPKYVFC